MKFKLTNDASWVDKEYADKLRQLGFKVKKETNPKYKQNGDYYIEDNSAGTTVINTLEELMDFIRAYGQIVLDDNYRE